MQPEMYKELWGNICIDTESKKNAWMEHFDWFLNTKFQWDAENLLSEPPVAGKLLYFQG